MNKLILALLASLLAFAPAQAADNAITLTPGAGVTERSIDVGLGVQAPGVVLVNSTGTNLIGAGSSVPISGAVTATQSGTWNIGTLGSITSPVAATQSGVWTVTQGPAGAAAWLVTGAGGTFPVTQSGAWTSTVTSITNPVAVTQSGTWNIAALTSITNPVASTQSGTWTVQPGNTPNTTAWLVTGTGGTFPATQSGTWTIAGISGTVSLPTGAATSANQPSNIALGAATSGQTGNLSMGLVTTAAPTYTTGTLNGLSIDTAGNLRVNVTSSSAGGTSSNFGAAFPASGTAIGLTNGTNMIAWSATSNYGTAPSAIPVPAVNANVTNTNANGQATAANSSPVVLASNQSVADPCAFQAKTNVAISTATGTTAVVTGVSAKKIYVCSMSLIAPSAVSVSLSEGSSATCGTSAQAGVIGVATSGTALNGMALAANGGLTLGNGEGTVAATATAANYLCLFQSGTAQLAGNLTYVQQ